MDSGNNPYEYRYSLWLPMTGYLQPVSRTRPTRITLSVVEPLSARPACHVRRAKKQTLSFRAVSGRAGIARDRSCFRAVVFMCCMHYRTVPVFTVYVP